MSTISQIKVGNTYYDLQDSLARNTWNNSDSYRLTKIAFANTGNNATTAAVSGKWYRLIRFQFPSSFSDHIIMAFAFFNIGATTGTVSSFAARIGTGSGNLNTGYDLADKLGPTSSSVLSGWGENWDSKNACYRSISSIITSPVSSVIPIDVCACQYTGSNKAMGAKGMLFYFSKASLMNVPNISVYTTVTALS